MEGLKFALQEGNAGRSEESMLLHLTLFDGRLSAEERLAAHQRWGEQFEPEPRRPIRHKRIRIGYVAQAFQKRPEASYLQPILRFHNRSQFEVYAYSTSEAIRPGGDVHWRHWPNPDADTVQNQILEDEIEVLVNFDGHMDALAMEVFARRAAPLQISMPTYAASTGVEAMDFRITDRNDNPQHYTEQLLYVPTALTYRPETIEPIESNPCDRRGYVVFGVFGNPIKIDPACLRAWACILARSNNARIVFHHAMLGGAMPAGRTSIDPAIRNRMLQPFLDHGIDEKRIAFIGGMEWRDHMAFHNEVDVLLDTHPFSGCTTTFEAMWMGVPTLTLRGKCFSEGMTHHLQSAVGFEQFSSGSWQELIDNGAALAEDPALLRIARRALRRRMARSSLVDAGRWTRELEREISRVMSHI